MAWRIGCETTQLVLFYQSCKNRRTITCQLGQLLLFSLSSNRNTSTSGLGSQELLLTCNLQCEDKEWETRTFPTMANITSPLGSRIQTPSEFWQAASEKQGGVWEKAAIWNGAGCVSSRRCQLYPGLGAVLGWTCWRIPQQIGDQSREKQGKDWWAGWTECCRQ